MEVIPDTGKARSQSAGHVSRIASNKALFREILSSCSPSLMVQCRMLSISSTFCPPCIAAVAAGRLEHNSKLPADSSERMMVGDAIAKAPDMHEPGPHGETEMR